MDFVRDLVIDCFSSNSTSFKSIIDSILNVIFSCKIFILVKIIFFSDLGFTRHEPET